MSPAPPSLLRHAWAGPAIGLLLGAGFGIAAGLHDWSAQGYLKDGMLPLAWATLAAEVYRSALYGLLLFAAPHLLAVTLGRWRRATTGWTAMLVCVGLGLGVAAGILLPLNGAAWYPGARTAAGMALNLTIPATLALWGLWLARRGGAAALARAIGARATGRGTAVAGALGLLACGAVAAGAHLHAARPPAGAPDVVIITIDALRYDHLSHNGYARRTSPNIDALAQESVRFTQLTTPRPKTTPSMVAMLTGLYPHHNGVRRLVDRLDPRVVTLEEVFRNAGYRTGALVCNYVLNGDQSGLHPGFEWYDDETPDLEGTQLDAAPATDRAIAWLARQKQRHPGTPVFLWVHYMDPHTPYLPPAPYDEAFVSERRGSRQVALEQIPAPSRLGDATDVDFYIDQYDGEILYTDHHVARLLAALDDLGMRERTILAVTADHGESLGEHDYYFEHGKYVYDTCARIPLLLRYPGVKAGGRITEPAELIDLFPTLLDLAGLASPAGCDGTSLRPLLAGGASPRAPLAYIERSTMMKGIRTPQWKVIHTYDTDGSIARRELYDLASDPGETHDLYAARGEQASALESALYGWTDQDPLMALRPGQEAEGEHATADVLRKLRALGYVQ